MYDVIVVGLGGAGSSSAAFLSAAGEKVLGLEQFGPTHARGSSHGRTRIYRTAYFEGAAYVPLVRRAQALWRKLEAATGEPILRKTGALMLGAPGSPTVAGALRTAEASDLEHQLLRPHEIRERFPQFAVRDSEVALWDPDAGVLFPENCLRGYVGAAIGSGAELHYGEPVLSWTASGDSAVVRTSTAEYRARSLVLTTGAWTSRMAGDLALPLQVERQFVLWFPSSRPEVTGPGSMPVFLWDRGREAQTYGIPDFGDGVKVGAWNGKVAATPEAADRAFGEKEAAPVREFVRASLPALVPRETEAVSCLYTNAPDHHFVLGPHPRHPNVTVVSACSGHGFKFTSVLGEVVARMVCHDPTGFDLALFDPGRFESTARAP
jgi:sarcosine oxidase